MISSLYILSTRGDTIIRKDFRSDVSRNANEIFFSSIKSSQHK